MKATLTALLIIVGAFALMVSNYELGEASSGIEAEVLPEIVFLNIADEGIGTVLSIDALSTHSDFVTYDHALATQYTDENLQTGLIDKFSELNSIKYYAEANSTMKLYDDRFSEFTSINLDDIEFIDIGNIRNAGLILRL